MLPGARSLPYGNYFGTDEVRRDVPGFSVSLLTPTLRAEDVPLHMHQNAPFVLVLSGSYRSSADGAALEQMLIFNPAGTTHRDTFVLPRGRFLAISITDHCLKIALDAALLPTAATAYGSGQPVLTAQCLVERCNTPLTESGCIEALCWDLLSTICGRRESDRRCAPPWIRKARELLHERCSDSLRITEIAKLLGVHPVYFPRAFRRTFRCTPSEYRMRCRLCEAIVLIRNKNLPLAEIALRSGFYDQSHLCTAFREHFGIAPHAYRRHL
jgi:AraC family transcriptional regulator